MEASFRRAGTLTRKLSEVWGQRDRERNETEKIGGVQVAKVPVGWTFELGPGLTPSPPNSRRSDVST